MKKMPPSLKKALKWVGLTIAGAPVAAIAVGICGLFFQPVGDWVTAQINWALGRESPFVNNIATVPPGCITGSVPGLLAPLGTTVQSVDLADGADQTYICDNATISAPKSRFAEKLAEVYPGCLNISFGIKTKLSLIENNRAVCRAHYQVTDGAITPTTRDQGVNICLGQEGRQSPTYVSGSSKTPRDCTDDELRNVGFLGP